MPARDLIPPRIDGFYRLTVDQMGTLQSYRFEEVGGTVADYAETQG